jgi:hypothetical protein
VKRRGREMISERRPVKRAHGKAAPRVGLSTAFLITVLALWPAIAMACPPVLKSVTVEENENHPTSTWTLPDGVSAQFIQTARSSETSVDGYFLQKQQVTQNPLSPGQTTFTDEFEFPEGTYYVHVAGHDKQCILRRCPAIEFSNIMTFEVANLTPSPAALASLDRGEPARSAVTCGGGTPGVGGGALPNTSGGPGPDKVAPLESLSFAPTQDVDRLSVTARMSEAGTLTASATVSVRGSSKVYRFKSVTKTVVANVATKLRLKLSKRGLRAVKRTLRRHKRVKAKVTVTARDKAGNSRLQKATIRLKR